MKMFSSLTFLPLAALILSTVFTVQASTGETDSVRPNIIMVVVDDVGFSDVGFNGNPVVQTPNLDRIAGEGLNLTNFHTSTVCAPGRAVLLTGRDHSRTGVWSTTMNYYRIRAEETVIAQPFKEDGYATGMFGKWHNGDNYPYRPEDRGFDEVVRHGGGGVSQAPDYWGNDYFDDTYFHNGIPKQYKGYCTDVWFDETMRFISQNKDRPFFAYVAPNTAHWPAIVPKEYLDIYRDDKRFNHTKKNSSLDGQIFYGMISNIDHNMGRLDNKLKELGLYDNTIVIFTSDNGSRNAEALKGVIPRFRGGKAAIISEGSTRVPTLLRWPAGKLQAGGTQVNTLTRAQDLMPTFIDIAGIKRPQGVEFDGINILPALKGDKSFVAPMQFEEQTAGIRPLGKFNKFTVRTQKWRLFGSKLIDIENDNRQKINQAKQHPEVVKTLRKAYEKWHDELEPSFSKLSYIVVGNDAENPSVITSHDWAPRAYGYQELLQKAKDGIKTKMDVPWLQSSISGAKLTNGRWFIDVETTANYTIELRRWPREANKPMTYAGPVEGMNADYMVRLIKGEPKRKNGKLVKMDSVRLKITNIDNQAMFDKTKPVTATDTHISFTVKLPKGKTNFESWMFDSKGKFEDRGAYYMYVTRH